MREVTTHKEIDANGGQGSVDRRTADGAGRRELLASQTGETVTVYQAYSPAIAEPALRAGTFVEPFRVGRMTWVKPSFLWMMYRCGWATKPDQERVLAVEIGRDDLLWALARACLSSFEPGPHADEQSWRAALAAAPVRVQWDPDRDLQLRPTGRRAIQIGLGPEASRRYVSSWIRSIRDVTPLAHEIHARVQADDLAGARALLPDERPLPLPPEIAHRLGASLTGRGSA
ncbi:DUF4291 domain-containing protein [Frankia sp. AgB1.9]|uniref:DUF4291 domain-containing protein n=1 Tax=unclassified Frankia TaxID=2632575 RepID=UPI001933C328|nr:MULTISPECIES: DUF4291 domain-containing protein [unclassified Frankia]MBL7494677.1 DUF4291 domain-containing protein [Frankia sp. AgW1.1]MBL7553648.1 DUF4291 domain-containing protein [Frankia sp. AgB1.9]MBL7617662.1 DUF4291 domain-containing protein [Frankia sp. AgB1.8]